MSGFKILDRSRAPEVEQISSDADVAGTVSFPCSDVSECMFHCRPLPESGASWTRLLQLSELPLLSFVLGDAHGPSSS